MKRLVLLSYGRESEYQRAIFAVLSFWSWYSGERSAVSTVIFTDNPAYFAPYLDGLPVAYVPLTTERLRQMQGPQQYVHRVKLIMLQEVLQQHPQDDALYFDSDTFFLEDPLPLLQRLAAGTSIMHLREYALSEAEGIFAAYHQAHHPRKAVELLESRTFPVGGALQQFHRGQQSWNSGVLGLPHQVASLLPDIIALNDHLYAHSGWFTSEQVAFSLVLQTRTALQPAADYVYHYWGKEQKVLVDGLLPALITGSLSRRSLPARLACIQHLTGKWRRRIELHRLQQGSLYAIGQGQVVPGLKYAAKALLYAPFDLGFGRRLLLSFGRKKNLTAAAG